MQDGHLTFGASSMRGLRPSMEDATVARLQLPTNSDHALFAVFDGHSGAEAAQFSAESIGAFADGHLHGAGTAADALRSAIGDIDAELLQREERSGSCAVIALLQRASVETPPTSLTVASLGDSRVVLARKGAAPIELSAEHKPSSAAEKARIEAAGGRVESCVYSIGESASSVDRINGGLSVARALGDNKYKSNDQLGISEQLVVSTPHLVQHEIDPTSDQFLLLACDGMLYTLLAVPAWRSSGGVDRCLGRHDKCRSHLIRAGESQASE